MAAALSSGATEVRVYATLGDARAARAVAQRDSCGNLAPLLAGEVDAVKPTDFDIGNSPAEFSVERCSGRTILMATTNGTRALVAARTASVLAVGALANATATAGAILNTGLPITMIGSGTQGEISLEDLLGCGAVIEALGPGVTFENDTAELAFLAWIAAKAKPAEIMNRTFSARNLTRAGLIADLAFCAMVDRFDLACRVRDDDGQLVVCPWAG
jgi:2-phosphosulfolactate phosphatase